ncbi:MAG: flagellar protein FlgN [Spirochaetaceae bacterium]|nr:flagellar protein FlgN [Spirochaetaceae bacterium]
MAQDLSEKELSERVAILTRFRKLLSEQQKKFREYLAVLEKQQDSLNQRDTENLEQYSILGNQIISNIKTLQKVKEPLAKLYEFNKDKYGFTLEERFSVEELQTSLDKLQEDVLQQNSVNQELLKIQMDELRSNLKKMANPQFNPYVHRQSIYATSVPTATIIDVHS